VQCGKYRDPEAQSQPEAQDYHILTNDGTIPSIFVAARSAASQKYNAPLADACIHFAAHSQDN
jgi:hypothetical protein